MACGRAPHYAHLNAVGGRGASTRETAPRARTRAGQRCRACVPKSPDRRVFAVRMDPDRRATDKEVQAMQFDRRRRFFDRDGNADVAGKCALGCGRSAVMASFYRRGPCTVQLRAVQAARQESLISSDGSSRVLISRWLVCQCPPCPAPTAHRYPTLASSPFSEGKALCQRRVH
jgi:hypothetical protein